MKTYEIAVIPGDGIGPEVISGAVKVLEAVASRCDFKLDLKYYRAGGCAIDIDGVPLPKETLDGCKSSDAVLLGSVGGPKWDNLSGDMRPEKALLGLRSGLGLYANLRPAILYKPLKNRCPIKDVESVDLIIVRELTGGIYFGEHGRYESSDVLSDGTVKGTVAFDTESYSYSEIKRILRVGFTTAISRKKQLTIVDKANVLESSRLWREAACEIAKEYPSVSYEFLYVDNAAMQLVGRPSSFDVIVTSNMFGDILSDEAGMITGSIGLLPSASLGADGTPGMFEPVHGSAPDIAGTDTANPIAAILSAAMLLRYSLGEATSASMIERAVVEVLSEGIRTPDIEGSSFDVVVSTTEMIDFITGHIKNS